MLAPPLLVSFSSVDDYISSLSDDLRDKYEIEIRSLFNKGLPPIVSSQCLSLLFGFSTQFINAMSIKNYKYYREFSIKKGKKKRSIQAPKVALKVIQKWFGFHLSHALTYENFVYGFVPGRSVAEAAQRHCNSEWVYSVDIKDFFPSTKEDILKYALAELGYSKKACNLIVPLCCYKDKLAQGAPSSPVLSNLVMKPLDQQLFSLSDEYDVTFTRYADDIVFSGRNVFPEDLKEKIKECFTESCWELSPSKEYFADNNKGQRLKVHGLLVHGRNPRLTKGYRNKIRAYKHLLKTGNIKEEDKLRLIGHINYSYSVEKK